MSLPNHSLPKTADYNGSEGEDLSNATETVYTVSEIIAAPLWILICYYSFIFVGMCSNAAISIALLRFKRNGVLSSILQLAVVDVLSTYVAVAEVWAINNHSWTFSPKLCPFYLGSEILSNTFVLYHIICINFHIISTLNLHLYQMQKDSKNPLTSYNDDEESEQCLVTRSESQILNRNVVIDYRRKKTDVSILFPSILVWFVCLSLSIPQYTLSNAVTIRSNCTLCTILDNYYRQLLQNLLIIFRVAIPLPLLSLSLLILIKKSYQSKFSKSLSQNLLTRKTQKMQSLLVFGISITAIYIVTSFQRQLFYLLHVITQEFDKNNIDSFKMPPLENITCTYATNLLSAMVHYSSSTLRAILYIIVLPELKNSLHLKRMCVCLKSST